MTPSPLILAAFVVAAYLLGSVPSGYILVRLVRGQDIRAHGSGNIGAANASRVLGRGWGFAVFAFDALKGALPAMLAVHWGGGTWPPALLGPSAAFLGHVFPVFLRFRGGKGVATFFGAFLALAPVETLAALGLFVVVFRFTRIASASSLCAVTLVPVLLGVRHGADWLFAMAVCLCVAVSIAHHGNVRRLLEGRDLRF
jgi:glycerol-3-phosphate acyltransferase PlsY